MKIDWTKPLECKVEGHSVAEFNHDWEDVVKVEDGMSHHYNRPGKMKVFDKDWIWGYFAYKNINAGMVICLDDPDGLKVWIRNKVK